MKQTQQPIKMLNFVEWLYKKYKVLSCLSERETTQFQDQVITLLVDQNENIDAEAHGKIKMEMGMDGFVLEILANVLKRNTFSNHYQVNKNIASIAEDLEKKTTELMKKRKILEKREQECANIESTLKNKVKEEMNKLEKQLINKLSLKEAEIKKRLNSLMNQLKSKEKIVMDRKEEISFLTNKLPELTKKQKQIDEKIKYLERKDNRRHESEQKVEYVNEIKELKEKNELFLKENQQFKKKHKNTELAYRKMKQDAKKYLDEIQKLKETIILLKSEKSPQKEEKKVKQQQKQNLEDLQLSLIEMKPKEMIIHEDDQELHIPEFLTHEKQWSPSQLEDDKKKLQFIKKDRLSGIVKNCQTKSYSKNTVNEIIEIVLELIEQGDYYNQILNYLGFNKFQVFFQKCYLHHETDHNIIESLTLIMSRVALHLGTCRAMDEFYRAIQLRIRVQDSTSILHANLECLLNYLIVQNK